MCLCVYVCVCVSCSLCCVQPLWCRRRSSCSEQVSARKRFLLKGDPFPAASHECLSLRQTPRQEQRCVGALDSAAAAADSPAAAWAARTTPWCAVLGRRRHKVTQTTTIGHGPISLKCCSHEEMIREAGFRCLKAQRGGAR